MTNIEKQINAIYTKVYKQVFGNKLNNQLLSRGSKIDIQHNLMTLQSSAQYNDFAKKFALELARRGIVKQKGLWRKYYQAAKAAHYVALPTSYKEFEFNVLSKAVQHNFNMIKSIPNKMLEILNHKYTSTLIEQVAKGTIGRGSFQRLLETHAHKQAKVIARTETAKLQTAITKYRATSLGSVVYVWRSSNDRRTRHSHREMNNVIVFWQDDSHKPKLDNMQGDAGEFPNCRCDAQPIVDEVQLNKSSYSVYDYNSFSIVKMSKNQLLEAIDKGSL